MGERSGKMLGGGIILAFLDECGVSSTPFIAKTWAPVGHTPVVTHPFNWDKISVMSVITTTGKMYFRIHPGETVKADKVVAFLRQFLRQVKGNIILYWDGLPAHRSKKVKDFLAKNSRLQIKRIPSYSPDLNPDEGVWGYMKTRELPNLTIEDTPERVHEVRKALRKIQHRSKLIKSFLFESELPWDKESYEFIAQSS